MCSEALPKDFETTADVLPLSTYGLSTVADFLRAEGNFQHQEWLKKAGLTNDEIKLCQEYEFGTVNHHKKIESTVLKNKLEVISNKISNFRQSQNCSKQDETNSCKEPEKILDVLQKKPITFYPKGHPMNELKKLEETLFGHLKSDALPITKRRKILRRLERKKERMLSKEIQVPVNPKAVATVSRPGSLWDVREEPTRAPKISKIVSRQDKSNERKDKRNCIIGPKKPTMYTVKDNKIVRLEPLNRQQNEYRAVDIVIPVNPAEEQLLEGTKMSIDDIKKIERFKDYEPGLPSKVLYLKNIAPSVTQERLSLLFNRFVLENGGQIDVRLMSGRMRGQAFLAFQNETLAIQALEEVNGTILAGRPIIVQFGRNSNRIQTDENR